MESIIENRHMFLAISVCTLLLSPLIIIIGPLFIAQTLFYERGYWLIQAPSVNYILFTIGFILLTGAFIILWLKDVNKKSVLFAGILIVACVVLLVGASSSYEKIMPGAITIKSPFSFEKQVYAWEDVEKVDYYLYKEHRNDRYFMFYFKDGSSWRLNQSGYVTSEVHSKIESKLSELETPYKLNFLE